MHRTTKFQTPPKAVDLGFDLMKGSFVLSRKQVCTVPQSFKLHLKRKFFGFDLVKGSFLCCLGQIVT